MLAALLGAAAILFLTDGSRLAALAAITLVTVGLVAGLIWQAGAPRRP